MNRRFTISGLDHLIRVLSSKPELMSLSSFATLSSVAAEAKKASAACGCNAAQVYSKNKGTFELALNNIQYGDHLVIKQVLNVDQICYYVKESNGGMKLKCI